MHEGLLIVSKAMNQAMFCNNPAQKLLKGALENFKRQNDYHVDVDGEQTCENRLLKYKFLLSTKMAFKG